MIIACVWDVFGMIITCFWNVFVERNAAQCNANLEINSGSSARAFWGAYGPGTHRVEFRRALYCVSSPKWLLVRAADDHLGGCG